MKPSRVAVSVALGVALIAMGLLAPVASADFNFGLPGSAAGQTSSPAALAADTSTGEVYVSDTGNKRIDVFAADGSFLRAFGWDVAPDGAPGDTASDHLETCTTVCQAGSVGAGGGQFGTNFFNGPNSIAVDNDPASPSYHDVYVVDFGNARVQRFNPSGAFVLTFGDNVNQSTAADVCTAASGNVCKAGVKGFGPGQFDDSNSVKVAFGAGSVYVADCTDCGGAKPLTAAYRVQTFDPSGALTGQPLTVSGNADGRPSGLAVDSAGDFYLSVGGSDIHKYDSGGNPIAAWATGGAVASASVNALALDGAGDLFVADARGPNPTFDPGSLTATYQYGSAGTLQRVLYGNGALQAWPIALALYAGDLFELEASSPRRLARVSPEPAGPVIVPFQTKADPIGNTSATLGTMVNPEGAATTYHFQYISQADYAANGSSFAGAHPAIETTDSPVGSDFAGHSFSAALTNLVPETQYRYRVIAADGAHTTTGPTQTFTTREPFEFGATYSTDVGVSAATVGAELNPLAIPATGRFQYVDDATYQADKATGDGFQHASLAPAAADPPLDFGDATDGLIARSAPLTGLDPDTIYHYRLLASDSFTTKTGPERTFHTFPSPGPLNTECPNQDLRSGDQAPPDHPSAALPDCRAYEQVSPAAKGGDDITASPVLSLDSILRSGDLSQIRQASADGSKLTYSSAQRFADPGAAPWSSQYLADRTAEGWQTRDITPPTSSATFYNIHGGPPNDDLHFQAFSDDLCSGFLIQDTDVALAPGHNPGYPDLYSRDNCADPATYSLLSVGAPSNQSPGYPTNYYLRVQGFSADGSKVAYIADGKLATSGVAASSALSKAFIYQPNTPISQLYLDAGAGAPRLISVMPDGSAAGFDSSLGTFSRTAPRRTGATTPSPAPSPPTRAASFGAARSSPTPPPRSSTCASTPPAPRARSPRANAPTPSTAPAPSPSRIPSIPATRSIGTPTRRGPRRFSASPPAPTRASSIAMTSPKGWPMTRPPRP